MDTMDNTRELELKCQALLQRIGELTQNYENAIADLRVALTNSEEAVQFLQQNQRHEPVEDAPIEDYTGVLSEVVDE